MSVLCAAATTDIQQRIFATWKTELNGLSNEWKEMKEALWKSLLIFLYVDRCSNKNSSLLTGVYRLTACQQHTQGEKKQLNKCIST